MFDTRRKVRKRIDTDSGIFSETTGMGEREGRRDQGEGRRMSLSSRSRSRKSDSARRNKHNSGQKMFMKKYDEEELRYKL